MPEISCLVSCGCEVGESPVFDQRRNRLWWVDIVGHALHAFDFASKRWEKWSFPATVNSIGLAKSGRLVLSLGGDVHLFDPEREELAHLALVEQDGSARLNDGKVGPDGAFWVGSMAGRNDGAPAAALYRVSPDGKVERKIEGLLTSNGLAWSPDGRTMYHSDSRGCWIDSWEFDPTTGDISDRRRLRVLTESEGRPDGAATDLAGCYWSCGVSAGCINRLAPDGALLERIPTPVPKPTMPCFGGPDMKTLFFTTLRRGLHADALARYPLSGGVFTMRTDIPGVPVGLFADR